MIKTLMSSALVAATLAGAVMVPGVAQARDGRNGALAAGAAAGVVGGALLGSAINNNRRDYYDEAPPPRARDCYFQRQRVWDPDEDAYVIQRVRVCQR